LLHVVCLCRKLNIELTAKSRGEAVTMLNALLVPLGINRMKRFMVKGLVVAGCLLLAVGCSGLKPKTDKHAAVEFHPCTSTDPPAPVLTNCSPSGTVQGLVDLVAALLIGPPNLQPAQFGVASP